MGWIIDQELASLLELQVIREWIRKESHTWISIGNAFLKIYDRDRSILRMASALRFCLRDGPPRVESITLTTLMSAAGITKIDYELMAAEVIEECLRLQAEGMRLSSNYTLPSAV